MPIPNNDRRWIEAGVEVGRSMSRSISGVGGVGSGGVGSGGVGSGGVGSGGVGSGGVGSGGVGSGGGGGSVVYSAGGTPGINTPSSVDISLSAPIRSQEYVFTDETVTIPRHVFDDLVAAVNRRLEERRARIGGGTSTDPNLTVDALQNVMTIVSRIPAGSGPVRLSLPREPEEPPFTTGRLVIREVSGRRHASRSQYRELTDQEPEDL